MFLNPKTVTSQTKKQLLAGLPSHHSPCGEGDGGQTTERSGLRNGNPGACRKSLASLGVGESHSCPGITVASHLGEIWDPRYTGQQDSPARSPCAQLQVGPCQEKETQQARTCGKRKQCHPSPDSTGAHQPVSAAHSVRTGEGRWRGKDYRNGAQACPAFSPSASNR